MIVDILFVLVIIGILVTIYKMKFSRPKEEIIRQEILIKREQQKKNQSLSSTQYTGEEDSQSDEEDNDLSEVSMKKRLLKQQKRRQKQQRKQAREQFLQQEKKRRQQTQKQQEERQKAQQEKRKKEEQYIEAMREEERKKKQEQFNKWKDMFSVEEQGKNVQSADVIAKKEKQFESNLINYLISKKLTQLQDLSHKFAMPTKQLVEKIKSLQKQEKLSGVFDERGKYLYIEKRQWDAVKNYIMAKGRIKKTDIMNECAKIIKIPQDQDQELINLISETSE